MRKKLIWIAPLAILAIVGFVAIGGAIVQLLWNWLLPAVFGVRTISFWQAFGLLVLSRVLFGGFGPRGVGRSGIRRRMAERWEGMTPDERDRFREAMRERWGCAPRSEGHGAGEKG